VKNKIEKRCIFLFCSVTFLLSAYVPKEEKYIFCLSVLFTARCPYFPSITIKHSHASIEQRKDLRTIKGIEQDFNLIYQKLYSTMISDAPLSGNQSMKRFLQWRKKIFFIHAHFISPS